MKTLKQPDSLPWLIQFTKEKESPNEKDIDLKRLKSFLPEVNLGHFNCYNQESTCSSLYTFKFPSFLLFRSDSSYEFYHGKFNSYFFQFLVNIVYKCMSYMEHVLTWALQIMVLVTRKMSSPIAHLLLY